MLLDRDGFAKNKAISFNDALSVVHFTLENRAEASHDVLIRIAGLPAGNYKVTAQNHLAQKLAIKENAEQQLRVPVGASGAPVSIERIAR